MKTLATIIVSVFTLITFGISKINSQWYQEYYYESGNLKKVVNYKGKQYHGTSTLYYDTPEKKVKMEVHYKEGKKTGFWTTKDINGNVIELTDYAR